MFVLCVSYSKDKRQKPGQSGQGSTDKVQRKNRKKKRQGHVCLSLVSVVCRQVEVSATV